MSKDIPWVKRPPTPPDVKPHLDVATRAIRKYVDRLEHENWCQQSYVQGLLTRTFEAERITEKHKTALRVLAAKVLAARGAK